jgi:hypothetical protein
MDSRRPTRQRHGSPALCCGRELSLPQVLADVVEAVIASVFVDSHQDIDAAWLAFQRITDFVPLLERAGALESRAERAVAKRQQRATRLEAAHEALEVLDAPVSV